MDYPGCIPLCPAVVRSVSFDFFRDFSVSCPIFDAKRTLRRPARRLAPSGGFLFMLGASQSIFYHWGQVNLFNAPVVSLSLRCADAIRQPTLPAPAAPAPTPQASATSAVTSADFAATKKAAESGDADAQFRLGVAYYNGQGVLQNYAEAMKWFRLAAESGDAEAQNSVGSMYLKGQGVPQKYVEAVKWFRAEEAVKWFRLAADQGDVDGQHNLGVAYYNGQGVLQNYAEAMKWFRLAAESGDAEAQNSVGSMYLKGQGVPQNYAEAVKWFRGG